MYSKGYSRHAWYSFRFYILDMFGVQRENIFYKMKSKLSLRVNRLIQPDVQTHRHTDIQTYRHTPRHPDIQTDIQTYI